MLQQQMLPRGNRVYHYPPGRNVNEIPLSGVAGGMHPLTLDMGGLPLRAAETAISQPIFIGASASSLANTTPEQQRLPPMDGRRRLFQIL